MLLVISAQYTRIRAEIFKHAAHMRQCPPVSGWIFVWTFLEVSAVNLHRISNCSETAILVDLQSQLVLVRHFNVTRSALCRL